MLQEINLVRLQELSSLSSLYIMEEMCPYQYRLRIDCMGVRDVDTSRRGASILLTVWYQTKYGCAFSCAMVLGQVCLKLELYRVLYCFVLPILLRVTSGNKEGGLVTIRMLRESFSVEWGTYGKVGFGIQRGRNLHSLKSTQQKQTPAHPNKRKNSEMVQVQLLQNLMRINLF